MNNQIKITEVGLGYDYVYLRPASDGLELW